jgi:aminopeptidase-like protein
MTIDDWQRGLDRASIGRAIYLRVEELYPICRSITGDGFRRTIDALRQEVDLQVHEVPTGTAVFDWAVPREWNVRDAFIKNSRGERVVDFAQSNLHVVSYSAPIHARMTLAELRPHLFTLPDAPDWIPYRTSYYEETWGFCLTQRQLDAMSDDIYEVCIASSLTDGHLTYGECYIPGATNDEVLISCHACHPSLCNDNLSGVALAAVLARELSRLRLRYSYRFLFIPATIGSITWLARNESQTPRIRHGLVLACVGDGGGITYKKSRRGDAEIDRAVSHVLTRSGAPHAIREFSPWGYDERQFCSPGFDLPVGLLSRTPHGEFPEYHTSADDLRLVTPQHLGDSFVTCARVFNVLERNRRYLNLNSKCEPQLGRRGLYRQFAGQPDRRGSELALLWVLNLSDGRSSLLEIAERAGLAFDSVAAAAHALEQHGLLREITPGLPAGLAASNSAH